MRVICKSNNGTTLSINVLNLGYTSGTIFSISIDKEYDVFAMSSWRGMIAVLLADDHHLPNWFPVECFTINDPCLPPDWSFASSLPSESGIQGIWGYRRLIDDASHYTGLLEREPEALRYFYAEERHRGQRD
jgi:hypothetical protein